MFRVMLAGRLIEVAQNKKFCEVAASGQPHPGIDSPVFY
jgi:hypothetical protein